MDISTLSKEELEALLEKAANPKNLTDEEYNALKVLKPEPVNSCQGCSMCCIAPPIEENHIRDAEGEWFPPKPAGKVCEHCSAPGHCTIYNKRPSVCEDYMCAYILGEAKAHPQLHGVAWCYQMSTPPPEFAAAKPFPIVVGHCMDVDRVMRDPVNWEDISNFMNMGVRVVIVRSPLHVVQLVPGGESRMVDIDRSDPMNVRVLESTERRSPYQVQIQIED